MSHQVQWTAPSPFWGATPDLSDESRATVRRPAILRYATDSFMDLFRQTLDQDPAKITQFEAQFETWETPTVGQAAAEPAPEVALPSNMRALIRRKVTAARAPARLLRRSSQAPGGSATAIVLGQTAVQPSKPPRTLKLYQPAHQRFYLVTACLVCRVPGLPDRTLDGGKGERVSYVLRRLIQRPGTDSSAGIYDEHAFIPNAGWKKVASETAIELGEEQLPMFPSNFAQDNRMPRRLFAALIPVGRREQYLGAREATATPVPPSDPTDANVGGDNLDPGAPRTPVDPRIALLSAKVAEPWKALLLRAKKASEALVKNAGSDDGGHPDLKSDAQGKILDEARSAIQVGSWYTLLDFAKFLATYLPNVAKLVAQQPLSETPTDAEVEVAATLSAATVTVALNDPNVTTPVAASLADALKRIGPFEDGLDQSPGQYVRTSPSAEWPDFLFPLADPLNADTVHPGPVPSLGATTAARNINALVRLIGKALRPDSKPVAAMPLAAQPVFNVGDSGLFVIRCLFERPECGPSESPVVSAPSRRFELASFFDPEAPARPIRIALPIDTSPAGLRKFDKNTAFMVSDMLCGQIARAKGLGFVDLVLSVLPFPFHKDLSASDNGPCKSDGNALGMICSLSIPIITICALILLLIIVSLLDIIFKWMPYLIFCFPLPGFKAKK
jgi:hypothetical protein